MAHVYEMQNRYEEGQEFMRTRVEDWAPDNGFAFHNWWHLGLYHLEQEDFDGVLTLYDEQILPEDSDVSLQMLDASAMLWRLYLQDIDVGNRWQEIAELWARKAAVENGYYAFNDLHALMAYVGDGRAAMAHEVLEAMEAAAINNPTLTAMMAREVGVPAGRAFIAFAEERHEDVVELLYPIRTIANRFGGSNAQRDILSQTLIEAAIRSGNSHLASNLVNERSVHRPFSPVTRRFRKKLS